MSATTIALLSTLVFIVLFAIGDVVRRTTLGIDLTAAPGRLNHLDGTRAIAALLVVMSHTVGGVAWALGNRDALALPEDLGSLGVQIFFSISGFLFMSQILAGKFTNPAAFFAGRVRRIVPLYLLVVTVAAFIAVAFAPKDLTWSNLSAGISNLYLSGFFIQKRMLIAGFDYEPLIGTTWTLAQEWLFYLFVPLLAFAATSSSAAVGTAALFLVFVFARASAGSQNLHWLFFLPGIVAAILAYKGVKANGFVGGAVLAVGAVAFLVASGFGGFTFLRLGLVAVVFLSITVAQPASLGGRTFYFLGAISYSIYLLHLPLVFLFQKFMEANWSYFPSVAAQVGAYLVLLVAIIGLSAMTHRYIESPFLSPRHRP